MGRHPPHHGRGVGPLERGAWRRILSLGGLAFLALAVAVGAEPATVTPGGDGCVGCAPSTVGERVADGTGRGTAVADTVRLVHEQHRSVSCPSCHTDGAQVVAHDAAWCSGCHHQARSTDGCVRCHDLVDSVPIVRLEEMKLPRGVEMRGLNFVHADHTAMRCGSCHGRRPGPLPADFSCAECHMEHHGSPDVHCLGCHREPPAWAHDYGVVHEGCSGGVCHGGVITGSAEEWPGSVCLTCHPYFEGGPLPPPPL